MTPETPLETNERRDEHWPDPTLEMLNGDPLFDAIWSVIKAWDIGVPHVYGGYTGGTGNHARAIYDAITHSDAEAGMVMVPVEMLRDIERRLPSGADDVVPSKLLLQIRAALAKEKP